MQLPASSHSGSAPLHGESIVYFGPEPWGSLWRNRHQLMSRLARHNRVLYVEPPMMTVGRLLRLWRDEQWGPSAIWPPGVSKLGNGLFVLRSPPWLPLTGRGPLDAVKQAYWRHILRRAARQLELERPIIWVSRPEMTSALGVLDEKLSVYHVVDEYAGYAGVTEEGRIRLRRQEAEMLRRAHLTIVVSPKLLQSKRRHAERVYLVPNAVDYEAYRERPGEDPPAEVAAIARPRIGYSGLVGKRLDLPLLRQLAQRRPDWSFVLLGTVRRHGCEADIDALRTLGNVHFLGARPVEEAPRYVRAFDVCLVPYRRDERAEHSSPLKIYEYAAAGKPIVATRFSAAEEQSDVVLIGDGFEQFEQMVSMALAWERSNPRLAAGLSLARRNTWDDRVATIAEILQAAMKARPASSGRRP